MERYELIIVILVTAFFNYLPRALGYGLARKMPSDHPLFIWMEYVAYAIIAALSVRLVVLPTNALGEFSLFLRFLVCLTAILFYLRARKYLLPTLVFSVGLLYLLDGWGW